MDFETVQLRLLVHINHLVRNGQITERGLARLTGVSQPHIHNVLKGIRALTPEIGDTFLRALRLDLLDLLEPEVSQRRTGSARGRPLR